MTMNMKKINWYVLGLVMLLVSALQACDDSDGYSIGDFSWDWATVRTTGGGGYYLEGDTWGTIFPAATAVPWFKPVEGERVFTFFNPLYDNYQGFDLGAKIEHVRPILTKKVEELTAENEAEFGNDKITIAQGDLWLGGRYLNLVFQQRIPKTEKHRISLVKNTTLPDEADGYVHLELRYNTYNDVSNYWQLSPVSYNLTEFFPKENENSIFKGFKIKINSETNGEVTLVLSPEHPVATPEVAKSIHQSVNYLN